MAPPPGRPAAAKTSRPKPNNQPSPGSGGNTIGLITPKPDPNGGIEAGKPTAPTNPPVTPETPKESGFWGKFGGAVHTGLDVLGFVPGLGAIPDLANAGLYALEGDMVSAGISAVAAVPGIGDAAKAGTMVAKGGKALGKEALEKLAEKAAQKEAKLAEEATARALKEAAEKKLEKEAAERALKEAAEKKVEKEAAEKAGKETAEGGGKPPRKEDGGNNKGKRKPGPCDHLRQGDGKGPYRGGAHSKTSKPANDLKDSHHMPAAESSPLNPNEGPAIQMDPADHRDTMSNGNNGRAGNAYRRMIEGLLKNGEWRKAMAIEIKDIRRIASEIGDPRKYNEATLEMLEYFKCLEKNGLLK